MRVGHTNSLLYHTPRDKLSLYHVTGNLLDAVGGNTLVQVDISISVGDGVTRGVDRDSGVLVRNILLQEVLSGPQPPDLLDCLFQGSDEDGSYSVDNFHFLQGGRMC